MNKFSWVEYNNHWTLWVAVPRGIRSSLFSVEYDGKVYRVLGKKPKFEWVDTPPKTWPKFDTLAEAQAEAERLEEI